jgi:hypothetical protein
LFQADDGGSQVIDFIARRRRLGDIPGRRHAPQLVRGDILQLGGKHLQALAHHSVVGAGGKQYHQHDQSRVRGEGDKSLPEIGRPYLVQVRDQHQLPEVVAALVLKAEQGKLALEEIGPQVGLAKAQRRLVVLFQPDGMDLGQPRERIKVTGDMGPVEGARTLLQVCRRDPADQIQVALDRRQALLVSDRGLAGGHEQRRGRAHGQGEEQQTAGKPAVQSQQIKAVALLAMR